MKPLITLALALLVFLTAPAQVADTTKAPYQRFSGYPPIELLLGDSASKYTKGDIPRNKPVLLMLFSPDCSHCQHTASELVKHKEEFRDIQLIMVTTKPVSEMNAFYKKYGLDALPGLVMGRDQIYLLPSWFRIRNFPYQAFYNKKGKLITTFEGSMTVRKMLDTFRD
ncbi:MAG TPA: thioredoxin fold domain-containing protein [Chitinophagaceae bacterium]|nr:thioredoxin fold domain-containing protein [Chitinophagaceae bacterium]